VGFDPQLSVESQLADLRCGRCQYTSISSVIVGVVAPDLKASMYGWAISSMGVWSKPEAHLEEPSSV
jgi:hypothetical protein